MKREDIAAGLEQNNRDSRGKVGTKGEHTTMTPLPIASHSAQSLTVIVEAAIRLSRQMTSDIAMQNRKLDPAHPLIF